MRFVACDSQLPARLRRRLWVPVIICAMAAGCMHARADLAASASVADTGTLAVPWSDPAGELADRLKPLFDPARDVRTAQHLFVDPRTTPYVLGRQAGNVVRPAAPDRDGIQSVLILGPGRASTRVPDRRTEILFETQAGCVTEKALLERLGIFRNPPNPPMHLDEGYVEGYPKPPRERRVPVFWVSRGQVDGVFVKVVASEASTPCLSQITVTNTNPLER